MNVMLIGLGPHAKRIYMKFMNNHGIIPKLIVDLKSNASNVKDYLKSQNLKDIDCYFVNDASRDDNSLPMKVKKELISMIKKKNITHAIISTEPKAHFAYAKFLLRNNINILMDKPVTAPTNVSNNINQAKKIKFEYDVLCSEYKKQKMLNNDLVFSIQCQRRFHNGYIYVKNLLNDIVSKYGIPISYIDIFHNDGMWNMPNEFIERENHPYKYGYGKIFHSGYHFIDLLTWLLSINDSVKEKYINKCSIYSECYRPSDFFFYFNNNDYKRILKTNKFDNLFNNISENNFNNFGEIDIHSIINFYNNDNLVTNCTLNLMQSGVSRRSWIELPIDTYKSNGRVRHERLNIFVGPLLNIQVHSYQAFEIKERNKHGSGKVGDLEHFDIYIFRNADLIGGKPFEIVKLSDIDNKEEDFIGYNEKARERCFIDFLNNVDNDSNILLHQQSIEITEKIYESIVYGGKKIMFDFNLTKNEKYEEIAVISDSDFGLENKINNTEPIIRLGARGIVYDDTGKIAILHKKNKNEYKLPGGGIEQGEEPSDTFKRECEEEIGCTIEIEEEIGTIIENKTQENFKQLSFVYTAKKISDLGFNKLSEQEKKEGSEIVWLSKLEALNKMKSALDNLKASEFDSIYRTKFMILRDIKILEYYLNKK